MTGARTEGDDQSKRRRSYGMRFVGRSLMLSKIDATGRCGHRGGYRKREGGGDLAHTSPRHARSALSYTSMTLSLARREPPSSTTSLPIRPNLARIYRNAQPGAAAFGYKRAIYSRQTIAALALPNLGAPRNAQQVGVDAGRRRYRVTVRQSFALSTTQSLIDVQPQNHGQHDQWIFAPCHRCRI